MPFTVILFCFKYPLHRKLHQCDRCHIRLAHVRSTYTCHSYASQAGRWIDYKPFGKRHFEDGISWLVCLAEQKWVCLTSDHRVDEDKDQRAYGT